MFFSGDLILIQPEFWILSMASFILIFNLFMKKYERLSYFLSLFTLFVAGLLIIQSMGHPLSTIFNNSYTVDTLGRVLKLFICSIGLFVFVYSEKYVGERYIHQGEYYVLCLFSILGMMVLISSANLLTVYLGIELLTLPLYALIAMTREKISSEAAMKYFVMGALSSGMLLYGISLLYGASASLELIAISKVINNVGWENCCSSIQIPILLGMVLVLVGLIFKFGGVPFHLWIPDVYQGSPSTVTLFISTLPKFAAFGLAIRLLSVLFSGIPDYWQQILILVAILSIGLGNTVAIAQSNIKRMLGYSAIGHVGFVILALIAGPKAGYASGLLYVIIYALIILGAFGIIIVLSHRNFEAENLSDFRGLGQSQPLVAFLMLLILFSLAGVPPTIGFYAKFMVLQALMEANLTWLAVVALIFTVIAAFYYLRIIRLMYFDEVLAVEWPDWHKATGTEVAFLSLNGLLILGLGLYPSPLINLCLAVFVK